MTEEQLAMLAQGHVPCYKPRHPMPRHLSGGIRVTDGTILDRWCPRCEESWPCDAQRLLDHIRG